jgi:predicted butyrate kinase (DUF1464 family)
MPRVVGTDPGTSSLDLALLVEGEIVEQARLDPGQGAGRLVAILRDWAPIDLIAGPSGYGLPLVQGEEVDEARLGEMALVRPDERGSPVGIGAFVGWVRAVLDSGHPTVILPGGIHLATVPAHRKRNAIDLGTADKVAVAALALFQHALSEEVHPGDATFAVVEVGSAFTAALVVERGRLVDASAGTRGPIGVRSGGAWDGEVACWLSPLSKDDLFRGGLIDLGEEGPAAFRESLIKHVAGLKAVTPFDRIYLSGSRADYAEGVLDEIGEVVPLPSLPGAWVKHAAQGSALLADGLAGGRHAGLVESLDLRGASGTIWDGLRIRGPGRGPFP